MCTGTARRSPVIVVVVVVVVAIVAAAVVVVRTQRPRRFVVCQPSVSERVEHRTHRPRRRRRALQTHREHDEHQAWHRAQHCARNSARSMWGRGCPPTNEGHPRPRRCERFHGPSAHAVQKACRLDEVIGLEHGLEVLVGGAIVGFLNQSTSGRSRRGRRRCGQRHRGMQ